jgi:hypothetical protein
MTTTTLAADLRAVADWFAAHPDVPEPRGVSRYGSGTIANYYVDTDADAEAILAPLDVRDRYDCHYDEGNWSHIVSGHVTDRLTLNVAVRAVTAEAVGA